MEVGRKRRLARVMVAAAIVVAVVTRFAATAQQVDLGTLLTTGKPAQLYAAALEYEINGDKVQASNLYHALIAKFPESTYTEKAIAKMEAVQVAAEGQRQAQEQIKISLEKKKQDRNICVNRCTIQLNQCAEAADAEGDDAVLGGLLDILTGGDTTDAVMKTTVGGVNADNHGGSCYSNNTICVANCS